ncbi:uncharacterized protein [Triticum aestivum]|uniref:uncharacterized protein n=1 Tax=Triticum aestivum TaxID=4565 RepID=UPI001D02E0EF|nr:uncharacterized protein LOC123090668 [Triticum aestivum]
MPTFTGVFLAVPEWTLQHWLCGYVEEIKLMDRGGRRWRTARGGGDGCASDGDAIGDPAPTGRVTAQRSRRQTGRPRPRQAPRPAEWRNGPASVDWCSLDRSKCANPFLCGEMHREACIGKASRRPCSGGLRDEDVSSPRSLEAMQQ